MLVNWIPPSPHTLPPNGSHRVGIGAFLLNQNHEGASSPRKERTVPGTQFPTGVVDEGENIYAAAVREVFTTCVYMYLCFFRKPSFSHWSKCKYELIVVCMNLCVLFFQIDSEFVEVLAFRQSHKSFFNKSDLFFVCMLQALSFDIQKQEQEIEAAQLMPFEDYAAQPFLWNSELLKYISEICKAKMEGSILDFLR